MHSWWPWSKINAGAAGLAADMVIFLCNKGHHHTRQWRADHCADCLHEAGLPVLPKQMALAVAVLTETLKNTPWEKR